MSWNLTKKLKETHLGPLASTFSRTPSSQTLRESSKDEKSGSSSPAPSVNDNGIAASEAIASQPQSAPRPGILIVTLHEGNGFSLPDQYKQVFSNHTQNSLSAGNGFGVAGSVRSGGSNQVSGSYSNVRPQTSGGGIQVPTNHGRISSKYLPYALLDFDKMQVFVNSVAGSPENPLWAGDNTQYKFDVSRVTELAVHLYLRNPNAPPGSGRSQDIFLGVTRINPRFEEKHKRESTLGQSGPEWLDVQYGTGRIRIGVEYVENRTRALKIDDFDLLKVVGKGSFGKVMQVKKKDTQRIYALKTIRKAHIISRSEVAHTLAERSVLSQINNPFIVPLKFTFQSPDKLYFVLAFVNGGELFHHLQKESRFDINRSRFYTAELLCALECLHGFNVIYRDLKPENILLDYSGHIALCDFGLCKLDMKDEDRTNTFCGTPEYLAPELNFSTANLIRDWVPNGASEIKAHPFFHSIDWRKLLQRKYEPTFKPNVTDALDTKNFDEEFTSQAPADSLVEGGQLSSTMQEQFTGWSYNRPVAGLGDGGGSIKDPSFVGSVQDR
ncbi:hypothetical protein EYC84_011156 [Monilinia fructicola]|uniref:non-specific serine/threonine protein kinase n=1 Tax=Monilinia fructicola TaxID=38448 RepID=A0A5M9J6V5_MONFR|nr:hypothetical protein EYC84_011156 [Monilinia fructicola]